MRRIFLTTLAIAALSTPIRAQFAVIDHGNLAQAVLIAERTLREYEALRAQYETLVRMSRGLGSMDRYRIPTLPGTDHDIARWEYGRTWLQGLNTGDPTGTAYRDATRSLAPVGYSLQQLPPAARRALEQAYATVDITDSIAMVAGHQVAQVRGYSRRLQQAIDTLEGDVVNPDARAHEMTAVLDKVAAGSLIARRQDMATNQLLSHALEQMLARSKRLRDSEAVAMNMRIGALRSGRTAGGSIVRGAGDDLRAWRQP